MQSVIASFGTAIPKDQWEDIMQSAMLRCLEKHKEGYKTKFTTSLYRFTVWECKNFVRQQMRTRSISLLSHYSDKTEDRIEHIRDCITILDPKDRTIIEQHFIMGMTMRDIGVANGYSPQAAMKNVHKALEKLRRLCLKDGV